MRENDVLPDVLLMARDDLHGLWEVVGMVRVQWPDLPAGEHRSVAERAVRTLLAKGWIELWDKNRDLDEPERRLPADSYEAALSNDLAWDHRGARIIERQVLIWITESGKEALRNRTLNSKPEA